MHIALQASNGKYVSAERGGGLLYTGSYPNQAYPDDLYPAPLYANRDEIGAWETFEYIQNPNGTVSFLTVDGYYLTAELGGGAGLSTSRREANAWECFSPSGGGFYCADGIHVIGAEQGSDSHMNCTRSTINAWETFLVIFLDKPDLTWPSIDECRAFKGNLCGLPLNLAYAPNGILFTPAYVIYDEATRKNIRSAYKDNGWRHYPINLTNHSPVYSTFYPDWDDSNINIYLEELLGDGLIPVGYVMGDHDTVVDCKADPSLVPIVVPKWEDTHPLKYPELDQYNTFYLVAQKYPSSLLYWHNPPYQGAPFVEYADWGLQEGDPTVNAKVWHYMVDICGVQGLLFQGKAWENNANNSLKSLTDFADRLGGGLNGWPIADLVDYEETAYYMFRLNGNYSQALNWTDYIRRNLTGRLNGFGNG